jgi:preprotein translocase subunit Sec63
MKLLEIKEAIYKRFSVNNTKELKESSAFKMATDGMGKLNLSNKHTWELLYRKWIGILPSKVNEQGYGCINGVNIFNYFRPWQVLNLDSKVATKNDIKRAFRQLYKVYHPDNLETGDGDIFNRLNQMYKSLIVAMPKDKLIY